MVHLGGTGLRLQDTPPLGPLHFFNSEIDLFGISRLCRYKKQSLPGIQASPDDLLYPLKFSNPYPFSYYPYNFSMSVYQ